MADRGGNGAGHPAGCGCTRCAGFEAGNTLAVTHGALVSEARLLRDPRVAEIAEETIKAMPWYSPADRASVLLFACTWARVERAHAAIEEVDGTIPKPLSEYLTEQAPALRELRKDLRAWVRLAHSLATDLGLSPAARLKMGLDAVRARTLTVVELHRLAALEAEEAGPG